MGQSALTVHMLTKPQVFYDNNLKQALGFQHPFYLKKAQQIRPMLYDGNVIAKETNVISIADSEETLMLEEESQSKMLLKQSDPMVLEKKVNIKPVNYAVLNQLSEDFGKHFVPQQELSDEQAFWFQMSNSSNESSDPSLVKVDVPSKLPKVSLVNTSLKKLKSYLAKFDSVVKTRITPSALTEDIVNIVVNSSVDINDSMKENVNSIEMCNKCLELEAELIKRHNMLNKEIFQKNNSCENQTEPTFNQMFELDNLRVEVQAKDTTIKKLKTQIKCVPETSTSANSTTIASGMYKLDPVRLAPRDKNNRETHIYYLKHTMKQVAILTEIVEQAKSLNPLDGASCKYVKLIQELLGYVESSKTSDSNTPVLSSTGVKCSTSTCRSKPIGNKRNDRVSQPSSSNIKNKVETQTRKVNKKNHVVEPICDANVKHTMLNANSQLICVTCKQCMFDANHDVCFLDVVNEMNMRAKSKSMSKKKIQLHNIWKPTCKIFTEVGLKWKPAGITFTLVGNSFPLTRITSTKVVPHKETTPHSVVQIVLWYLDSGCSKHMTGDRSQLTNFVHKFLGTVKFGNDQIAKIMGYGDYQIGNVTISRVYYVEG
ncbi:hypothetical protein Tco_0602341 [Tanacetum coccineum]